MRFFLLFIFIISFLFTSCTKSEFNIREHYIKKEFRIPMRDGITLFTSVYLPKDSSKTYPILMVRTPYRVAPYGSDSFKNKLGPSPQFAKEGYIFVYQDVRGRFMSEGRYLNMRPFIPNKTDSSQVDESSDTYDTIDWLLKHISFHNGKVGLWGISYPGFYAAMGMINAHPALKAVSPQAPIANWFIGDDMHHNGALSLTMTFNFFSSFGVAHDSLTTQWPKRFKHGTPDGYRFFMNLGSLKHINERYFKHRIAFWDSTIEHGTYDSFWQRRNILPHIREVKPAVLIVGGWFDAEDLYGPLHIFKRLKRQNHFMVMGPWAHGGWARSSGEKLGNVYFGSATSTWFQDSVLFPFFQYYLKNKGAFKAPAVQSFDTGAHRWRSFSHWPPKEGRKQKLFLNEHNHLSFTSAKGSTGFDAFISDPAHPVPFINKITNSWEPVYIISDQRFASTRPDVLTFQSDVLQDSLTLAGPLTAELYVSTTGTDADWVVKLIDVYPDTFKLSKGQTSTVPMQGFQQLVRAEIFRGKFRDSFANPRPFIPNKVTRIRIPLQDVFHTYLPGHRLMVQVQSSWFPLFDRNPQTFVDIYHAKESDFKIASHRVYHSAKYPSGIIFTMLNK